MCIVSICLPVLGEMWTNIVQQMDELMTVEVPMQIHIIMADLSEGARQTGNVHWQEVECCCNVVCLVDCIPTRILYPGPR